MGFFGNYKKLHELSIDNQPQEDDEPTSSYTPEESDDEGGAGTPPAEETPVEPAQEPAPAAEEPPADDGADPYAIPADDEGGGEEPVADDIGAETDAGIAPEGGDTGEEDPYAIPGEGDTGAEGGDDDAEGTVGDDTGTEGDEVDSSTGSTIASDLKSMEDEIFADLSDQQKDIRDNELKQNYILLYDTIDEAEKRINNIVKDEKTGRVLEFITRKMNELKRLIHHNLTKVFDSRTYIENQTALQQCIAIMNTICNMLDSIAEEDEDKNDE